MSETTNYHLPLTDDDQTRFLDWRNSINGPGDSAMKKIDTVLSEKADNSRACALTTSGADTRFLFKSQR